MCVCEFYLILLRSLKEKDQRMFTELVQHEELDEHIWDGQRSRKNFLMGESSQVLILVQKVEKRKISIKVPGAQKDWLLRVRNKIQKKDTTG